MDAFLVPSGGGDRIENPLGGEIVFKARGAQTGEALTVFEATNARKRRSLVVKWFRRYAVGCLIAVLLFSGRDSYNRPGEDMRYGAILMVAAG